MAPSTSKYSSRRSVKPADWNLCIFCQTSNKDKLFNISTFSVSNKILQDSKLENTMRLRLAGVNDLIAAEGKYHNKCLNAFKYDIQKTKKECETIDLAMIFLVQELGYAASKNQILQLSEVWERYCSLVAQTNGDILQSFISRRTTFKEYLQNRLSDEYQFLRPLHRSIFEREPC